MKALKIVLYIVGVSQLVLGALLLFVPDVFVAWMGLSHTGTDIHYLFGMLSARFLAYGVGMFYIARDPMKNVFWIQNMIAIQVIDLGVGLFYTATGVLTLAVAGFPMFNAALFTVLLWWLQPKHG